jgi:predicted SnoaL-like aldol condensation-catalyzing enzyme
VLDKREESEMRGEDNVDVVRRFWREVFGGGELEVADEIFAADHRLDHPALPEGGRGPEVVKAVVGVFRKLSPELRVSIEDEISEGEKVVTRWSARGRAIDQEGPEDPGVAVSGVAIFRVSDGVIRETWLQFQSLDDRPKRIPKSEELRRALASEDLFRSLGEEAAFGFKCWIRPWTCRLKEQYDR